LPAGGGRVSGVDAGGAVEGDARQRVLAGCLALLVVIIILEIVAGVALRPARQAHHQAQVLATPGVPTMIHGVALDPTELAQVAAGQHQPSPLALPSQALIDGLLLVSVAGLALPRLLPRRLPRPVPQAGGARRGGGLGPFLLSLAILLVSIAVAVVSIARLRYLVALYLSPPLGTLSYLLLYGSFRRGAALVTLTVLMVLKVAACFLVVRAFPRAAAKRGLGGLALTSVGATVATTVCYALAPTSLGTVVDALAAAVVALVALLWAGVIVSGSVRRLV
jgi:hypothetical protein